MFSLFLVSPVSGDVIVGASPAAESKVGVILVLARLVGRASSVAV